MRCKRIVLQMVFVELTPFIAFRQAHWSDDELRELQNFLLASPDAGKVIRGSNGLRKLRWALQARRRKGHLLPLRARWAALPDLRVCEGNSRKPHPGASGRALRFDEGD